PTLPRKEPAVTPPAGDDRRGDLVHGVRTLTGTVERTGGCVLLRVGAARWELTGAAARTLVAGRRVRVGGAPLPTPPQCGATGVFVVSRWTPAAS
ncbi:MAG TPA: hypothetical protein VES42_02970, partial [Pilimelia sp.]|nr:hypothetical protein [Pilimelia sp.]